MHPERQISHALESVRRILAHPTGFFDQRRDVLVQTVHYRIGMRPAIGQRCLIESREKRLDRWSRQQPTPRRDQQADRVVYGIHAVDQPLRIHKVQHVEVIIQGRPRRERDQRWAQRDSARAEYLQCPEHIRSVVSLFQVSQHHVAERLDGRYDKGTTLCDQLRHDRSMFQDVLDFRRDVKAQIGKLVVHGPNDAQRVLRSIQKVRVAVGDVFRPGAHQATDVLQDDRLGNDKEPSPIDRRDRAMQAQVQAAPARFHVACQPFVAVPLEAGIFFQRRQCDHKFIIQ